MNTNGIKFGSLRLFFAGIGLIFSIIPGIISAQTATTFPASEAGMAAYVKLDSISPQTFDNAKLNLFDSIISTGDTYFVAQKAYLPDEGMHSVNLRIYLGADGWLVVYLPKYEAPSKIVNWRNGAALSDTLLKIAIEEAIQKMGATASAPFQYYNFAYPDAKKMTLVRDSVGYDNEELTSNYTVYIPGSVSQASFALRSTGTGYVRYAINSSSLTTIANNSGIYDFIGPTWLPANTSRTIETLRTVTGVKGQSVTVILYNPN